MGHDDKSLAAPQSYGPALVFWTNAFGAWADFDGNKNAASADRNLGGFVSGMDAHVAGSWRAGLATGASFSDISVDARHSGADVDSFHLGGYAGGAAGPLALRGGGAWTWNDIDTSRAVIFPGFFEREKASYGAGTGQIFGEVAYPTAMGAIALEPFADIAGVSIDTDSFKEHGGRSPLCAAAPSMKMSAIRPWASGSAPSGIGVTWSSCRMPRPLGADVTPEAALAFASTGIGFTITGVPLAQDSALIDAGLDFALGPGMTLGASYSGQIASDLTDNAVKGRFTWLF